MQAEHHIGTSHIGSDAAETEALFWAGLWRISQNNRIPTAFLSDSRLVGDQAAGRIGSIVSAGTCERFFRPSDPFNELADWLAKQEAQSSLFLKRQPVNMQTFGSLLQHLWMAVVGHQDLPQLTASGSL